MLRVGFAWTELLDRVADIRLSRAPCGTIDGRRESAFGAMPKTLAIGHLTILASADLE